jgi:hypothetical protein
VTATSIAVTPVPLIDAEVFYAIVRERDLLLELVHTLRQREDDAYARIAELETERFPR